jgi:predicted nucleic acid-binding protein
MLPPEAITHRIVVVRNQKVLLDSAASTVEDLRKMVLALTPQAVPQVVASDPDDDHVLAAAVAAGADLIASGDRRDLLPLGSYQGIPIVTVREALERIGL